MKCLDGTKLSSISVEEVNNVAKIVLSKAEMVNPWLNISDRVNSLFS